MVRPSKCSFDALASALVAFAWCGVAQAEPVDPSRAERDAENGLLWYDLRLVVLDQGVVLEGRATCYYAKQLAQHVAMAVTGLPLVANRIEVCGERS